MSFIRERLSVPVVLVGMMGAGKTHVGGALARALDWPFYDTDRLIEEKAGLPVTGIFENFGEEKFRSAERNTIQETLARGQSVIATGGGALTSKETLALLKEQSVMVWLNADLDILWERVQKSQGRPLLHTDNPREKLEGLLEARRGLYEQAHIHCEITGNNQQNIVDEVIKGLSDYLNTDTL